MNLRSLSFDQLLAAFSDPSPTPGGGSACALAASIGLSLLAMVAGMGRTRHGSDDDRRALDAALEALVHLRDRAAELMSEDAAAYQEVVAAYRLPKGDAEEQARRREAIQSALRGAADVPLELARLCHAALTAAGDVARHGNPAASSYVGVALELLRAGARGAALNVRANLGSITDAGFTGGVEHELKQLEASLETLDREARAALA